MRLYRTYHPEPITQPLPATLPLDATSYQHLCKVLRLTDGTEIHVVDNSGGHFIGTLTEVTKKSASVSLTEYVTATNESPLQLELIQVISRGDRMDLTIQKAVELGVTKIIPVFSERCGVNLSGSRLDKKLEHWQNIAISACLQSYRDTIPEVTYPVKLDKLFDQLIASHTTSTDQHHISLPKLLINLNPFAGQRLRDIHAQDYASMSLLIGSEGGLSDNEISKAHQAGFCDFNLGPRVLRTETTGLTAIAILQALFGDL